MEPRAIAITKIGGNSKIVVVKKKKAPPAIANSN